VEGKDERQGHVWSRSAEESDGYKTQLFTGAIYTYSCCT